MSQLMISPDYQTQQELRVLLVEDSVCDAELALAALRKGGFEPIAHRVETEEQMTAALSADTPWDIILSDYSLPRFSGPAALETLKRSKRDIPFIMISGAVGEDVAVASLKAGAHDFLVKGQFSRLTPAVKRELAEANNRRAALLFEKKFMATFEQAAVGIAHVAASGKFLLLNRKFCEILGYTQEESVGLNFQTITHPDDLAEDLRQYRLLLAGEIDSYAMEKRYIRKDRSLAWVNLTVSPVRDEQSQFEFAIAVIEDITRRKQAEEDLQKYALLLERSNKELEEFATIASHDLQEPLRKVQIFSDMLTPLVPAEGKDYICRMKNSTQRMQALISDLLALSRVHRKGKPFKLVQLDEILTNVLDDMELGIRETGAEIESSPLGLAYGDQGQLYQLFQNLISNALKYRPENQSPVIRVYGQCTDEGRQYQVTVEDNGIGIPPAFFTRILKPFQRLHSQAQYPGNGIGLTICKKIIDRHNGTLKFDSEPGQGTRVIFSLPTMNNQSLALPEAGFQIAPQLHSATTMHC
jgi:PAS domain S-box-containing protein